MMLSNALRFYQTENDEFLAFKQREDDLVNHKHYVDHY